MSLSDNKVYANAVKHGDLDEQQIAEIQKQLLISLRSKEAFWDKFCSHTAIGDGKSSYEWRKLNVPQLLPSQVADLEEGKTPAGLTMEYVKFSVTPVDFGSWIGYTDVSKKYNFDDVVRDAKVVLGQRAFEEVEIRKARKFVGAKCTMDLESNSLNKTDGFMKSLLKARTILRKNHIKPIRGNRFGCILTPEQAAQVLLDYETQITHTSEKEAIINGYIGELGGFILFENADPIMYKAAVTAVAAVAGTPLAENAAGTAGTDYYTRASSEAGAGYLNDGTYAYTKVSSVPATHAASTYYPLTTIGVDAANEKGYCLFIGKTEYGMPVQTVSFGNANIEMYNNELGKAISTDANGNVVADVLHQHGSVGYKAMGFAVRVLADEAILRAEFDLGNDGAVDKDIIEDGNRTGYQYKHSSPAA